MVDTPKRKNTTEPRSFRFTEEGDYYLGELAKRRGLSKTGFIEMTVRDLAREVGIPAYSPVQNAEDSE